ncbi:MULTISPECIES: hypothetical protein [Clostridium]|uniref:Uncharacterized protein n=2 Tax=Clostridium butyricum TaxID=1492 RepID=C4IBQ4_CLOBU|nr:MULTISPECIES: hypothetical protein [Clostridium]MDU4856423.1 hypothetical protein [Clostridioides difficile]ALR90799.1 hypothetical protein ATN24_20415 [Clostridium butyricum]ALS19036.1 hypothetical protein ATD26_19360 [Clostridium butyricum]ANF16223.1 hypothetical protein AZ909_19395 [Clostridium butyricum]AOR96133.1 hypothetical protein BBB49_18865 [Clostridium butyricum]
MSKEQNKDNSLIQNLEDAGCSCEEIRDYLKYDKEGLDGNKICLLIKQRKYLLDCIHETQKQLDCLDYLLYKVKGCKCKK